MQTGQDKTIEVTLESMIPFRCSYSESGGSPCRREIGNVAELKKWFKQLIKQGYTISISGQIQKIGRFKSQTLSSVDDVE